MANCTSYIQLRVKCNILSHIISVRCTYDYQFCILFCMCRLLRVMLFVLWRTFAVCVTSVCSNMGWVMKLDLCPCIFVFLFRCMCTRVHVSYMYREIQQLNRALNFGNSYENCIRKVPIFRPLISMTYAIAE